MRILWASNAPWAGTGYGQQTAQVTQRLAADGHDVAIAANYGLGGNTTKWQGIPILPQGFDGYSNDIIPSHAEHWLGGEPGDGWLMTLFDVWALRNPRYQRFNIAAWVPVDHRPTPPLVAAWLRDMFAVPIAMSRFGEEQLRRAGLDPLYAPHGIDTNVYRPGDRAAARDLLGLPGDAFVVLMNAANKSRDFDRKSFFESFAAFSALARERDDAVLYVHAEQHGIGGGIDLGVLSQQVGIPEERLFFTDQYAYRCGLSPRAVAMMYQASDVLLAPSKGEGFGIPVIEAQACGIPAIASDFTAQPELVGDGWLVDGEPVLNFAQGAYCFKPYVASVIDALFQAYEARSAEPSEKARAHGLLYDCDRVFAEHWRPIMRALEARTPTLAPVKAIPA